MSRKEFISVCKILGLGSPFLLSTNACSEDEVAKPEFRGKVIIIGAGAGGLSSGHLLQQKGVEFEILEASSIFGGRMRIDTDFADFPIPLGAEWLETDPDIFEEIVNDSSIQINIDTFPDAPDHKFVDSSWFSFYESYIVPSISSKITYNTIVQSVDYSGTRIVVTTKDKVYEADKVIVCVPLKILQDADISFTPNLPQSKSEAIGGTTIWAGFKAFIEFSEDFFGNGYEFEITPKSGGEKVFYNAAQGQNSSKHILGLFAVGKPALTYVSLSETDFREAVLSELDEIFSNQATPNYIRHIIQNWNNEPFIRSGYMTDHADWRTVKELGKTVADKIYFAGGAYTDGEDWVSVHAAARSASATVQEMVN